MCTEPVGPIAENDSGSRGLRGALGMSCVRSAAPGGFESGKLADSLAARCAAAAANAFADVVLRAYIVRRELLIGLGAGFRIIGSRFSPDARRLREFAARNRLPHRWIDLEEDQAAEALNFNLSAFIYLISLSIVTFILIFVLVGVATPK